MLWDVAIVGAGPAGTAAAIRAGQLRPDARVLLLDAAAFPRDKACGDGIAAHAVDMLRDLGALDAIEGYPPVHLLRMVAPGRGEVAGPMRRPSYIVPRKVFDARLLTTALARGAELRRHRVRELDVRGDRVVIDGEIEARVVVGADGANSTVRAALELPDVSPRHLALAIRGYAPAPAGEPVQLLVLSEVSWPAYAWSFPIGDGSANVGYGQLLDGRPVRRKELLEQLAALIPGLGETTELRAHHLPLSSGGPHPGSPRLLLAGDSATLINPLTGEGIYYALLSGALAGAAALHPDTAGTQYRKGLDAELGRHLRHSRLAAFLAGRPAVVDAAIGACAARRPVFDDFVELGLGRGLFTARALRATGARLVGNRIRSD
jgi:geranylgeranyl reductase family protein